ncbi:hypothetical protein BSK62_02780 [Paenibacillus odorifer]|jgi:hypothetical protein|uniref:DUF2304 domain-containing protein n=1 Tax=Paenibacillus TaxID=44249 RepID=UPI00096F8E60|nr:hypothetical protein [Paenibacillus sp. PastH-4]MDH6444816.1 hypothetical protein [Paenibacillus sp. PastF-4]MDH6528711.1 hypothetical protein [Paenibacillus sp. PastH-3]OMC64289.1 hypothetical protein BK121_25830 [Paenibacillus odorifer]OMD00785.1 hypothetical protein BJP49_06605 [Paenibacillus odorifer]
MIPFNLQLILIILSSLIFVSFIVRIKAYKIELKYTILWIVMTIINILIAIFPNIVLFVSKLLSIETPVNTLFLFGIMTCLMILYNLTSEISKNSIKIRQLSQEVGLLKNELKQFENERKME